MSLLQPEPPRSFDLALVQMSIVPGARDANLAHALEWIARSAGSGADVVLLPEALPLGWRDDTTATCAEPIPDGAACVALRDAARRHRIHVCAGLAERAADRIFNAAVLIDPAGEVLLHHRKINELAIARDVYAVGDRLGVVETTFGTIGVMICADGFADGLAVSRTLGLMGAQVVLSPCAWAVPPDHDNARSPYGDLWRDSYGPVAREYGLWIAGASNVGPIASGPWRGHACIGASMVVGPSGSVEARGPYGVDAEALLHVRITLPAV